VWSGGALNSFTAAGCGSGHFVQCFHWVRGCRLFGSKLFAWSTQIKKCCKLRTAKNAFCVETSPETLTQRLKQFFAVQIVVI
jgi:hypothetical protein